MNREMLSDAHIPTGMTVSPLWGTVTTTCFHDPKFPLADRANAKKILICAEAGRYDK